MRALGGFEGRFGPVGGGVGRQEGGSGKEEEGYGNICLCLDLHYQSIFNIMIGSSFSGFNIIQFLRWGQQEHIAS